MTYSLKHWYQKLKLPDSTQNVMSWLFATQGVMSNHADLFSRWYCRLDIHLFLDFCCQLYLNKGQRAATIHGATNHLAGQKIPDCLSAFLLSM